jgi:hypothetical protein
MGDRQVVFDAERRFVAHTMCRCVVDDLSIDSAHISFKGGAVEVGHEVECLGVSLAVTCILVVQEALHEDHTLPTSRAAQARICCMNVQSTCAHVDRPQSSMHVYGKLFVVLVAASGMHWMKHRLDRDRRRQ